MKQGVRLDDLPDVMTVDEAAKALRCGRRQLYEAIARGEIPHFRIGRSIRVGKVGLLRRLAPDIPDEGKAASGSTPTASRGGHHAARPSSP